MRDARVEVRLQLKYLGIVFDGRWTLGEHFARMGLRLRGEIAGFGRLLPNLGGSGGRCRRLYVTMVGSIALYGVPVWWQDLRDSRHSLSTLKSVQRLMALQIIRGYRTIALEMALMLAGTPPWELEGRVRSSLSSARVLVPAFGALS